MRGRFPTINLGKRMHLLFPIAEIGGGPWDQLEISFLNPQSRIKVAVVADLVRDAGPATRISASIKPSAELAEHLHRPHRRKHAVGHFPGHTVRTCRVCGGSADESIGSRFFSRVLSLPASRNRPCASLTLLLH